MNLTASEKLMLQWIFDNEEFGSFISIPCFNVNCQIGTDSMRSAFMYKMRGILFIRSGRLSKYDKDRYLVMSRELKGSDKLATYYMITNNPCDIVRCKVLLNSKSRLMTR